MIERDKIEPPAAKRFPNPELRRRRPMTKVPEGEAPAEFRRAEKVARARRRSRRGSY